MEIFIGARSFWSGAAANAVVVEADAFKETDVIYKAFNSMGHHEDILQTAELVYSLSLSLQITLCKKHRLSKKNKTEICK